MVRSVARYVVLFAVTLSALVGMIIVTTSFSRENPATSSEEHVHRLTATAVTTERLAPESVAIIERFSGRLQPLEQFRVSFEISGRLSALGRNEQGERLDEGMQVRAGQPLAQLENAQWKAEVAETEAQLDEAKARLEQAESNLARVEELQRDGDKVITPEEYEDRVFAVKEARARLNIADAKLQQAQKRLDDSTIYAPDAGVISRRYVLPGESLNPHEPVFEIVQIDEVLLVVGVPESKVRRIRAGQSVAIELIGRDARGARYPERTGQVRYVPSTADATSGLFQVEIAIANSERELRPGMIGLARVTSETVPDAFRIPTSAVVFRTERGVQQATIFTIDRDKPANVDESELADVNGYAQEYKLQEWIEQGDEIVVTGLPPEHREVVVRGQFRLVAGRPVHVLSESEGPTGTPQQQPGAIVDRS